LDGKSLTDVWPGWQEEPIMNEWAKYAKSEMGELSVSLVEMSNLYIETDGADDNDEELDRDLPTFRKKRKYAMAMDEDGNRILPDPDRNGGMSRTEMEQMIWTFVMDHYCMGLVIKICIIMLTSSLEIAANNPKASVPWTAISSQEWSYVDHFRLPKVAF
jgi:hypothetical protein